MATKYEKTYIDLCITVLNSGKWVKNERTGRYCLTLPEFTYTIDASKEPPPLLTTKQSYPVSALAEILGYLRRYEWADLFEDIGTKTWYVNANETEAWLNNPNRLGTNHIGKVYGAALENWELQELFYKLSNRIDDRGLMINFWRPEKFKLGCLRPCMYAHLFTILDGTLHLKSMQRSCDLGLGANFNSLQCYFLMMLVCKVTGLKPGIITHTITNVHIYDSHIKGIRKLISRLPTNLDVEFKINDWVKSFDDIVGNDKHAKEYFTLKGYEHSGAIKFDLVA